jgi:hypothetical protein
MMESVNPEECLNGTFKRQTNRETEALAEITHTPYAPHYDVPLLEIFPAKKRAHRTAGTDLTYWSILNLRQKL